MVFAKARSLKACTKRESRDSLGLGSNQGRSQQNVNIRPTLTGVFRHYLSKMASPICQAYFHEHNFVHSSLDS